jgi:hypothetical protein
MKRHIVICKLPLPNERKPDKLPPALLVRREEFKPAWLTTSLASSIVTYMAQQKGGAMGSLQSFPLTTRITNALVSYCGYIGKMVWPADLAVLYPHPGMLPTWEVVAAVLFLSVTTFLIIWNVKRYPYLTTGWLWYLGTLVPVIGLVQVGAQAMADRYTYTPIIGVSIMIAWGILSFLKNGDIGMPLLQRWLSSRYPFFHTQPGSRWDTGKTALFYSNMLST